MRTASRTVFSGAEKTVWDALLARGVRYRALRDNLEPQMDGLRVTDPVLNDVLEFLGCSRPRQA